MFDLWGEVGHIVESKADLHPVSADSSEDRADVSGYPSETG